MCRRHGRPQRADASGPDDRYPEFFALYDAASPWIIAALIIAEL
jgi:hypothetical protein